MTFGQIPVFLLIAFVGVTPSSCFENTIMVTGMLATKNTQSYQPNGMTAASQNHLNYGLPQWRGTGAVSLGGGKALFTGGTDGKDIATGSCPHDIVFILDASGSIGIDVFKNYVLKFVAGLTERAGVSYDNTHIGVVVFSSGVDSTIPLTQYTNSASLVSAIDRLVYTGGDTDITGGLQKAFDMVKVSHRTVSPSLVLITDGKNDVGGTDPVTVANQIRSSLHGTVIISIAIPGNSDYSELLGIAGNNPHHVFNMTQISGLQSIASEVLKITNSPCQPIRNGGVYQDVYIYDANFQMSTKTTSMLQSRFNHGITIKNGVVTVCGGSTQIDASIKECEQYSNNQWRPIASLPIPLTELALTSTPNGILAIGGDSGAPGAEPSRRVFEYDPTRNAWDHRASLHEPLRAFGAIRCPNSELTLVCGGFQNALSNSPSNKCYVYDPSGNGYWLSVSPLSRARAYFSFALFTSSSTSTVYALGGTDGSGADSSVDMIATCPHGGGVQMSQNMPESVEQAATVGIV